MDMARSNKATGNPLDPNYNHWLNNFYQMESVKKGLIGANDDDVCYISDIDEIWRPNLEFSLGNGKIYKPLQDSYLYYLNYKTNAGVQSFNGTSIIDYKTIKNNCLNDIKNDNNSKIPIKNGGWHYEAFGGKNAAETKIMTVKCPDYYNAYNITNNISDRIRNNLDYKGRNLEYTIDNNNLPEYVKNNIETYKEFLL
jgi:hypothetical protein